ncbi:hypothetical protein CF050_07860 [Clostridium botulinum]|nr:hypothetical protein [Clostridium botulinum]NFA91741.1 hypothetical protein [Clostridium botulinum]NFB21361.1 hypothetical protein [Clostridium botulinum]NFI39646.1 hypothetical protein [Clostridium botulinum]NFT57143.1 hypothetical protein [Clostridium botulinum]
MLSFFCALIRVLYEIFIEKFSSIRILYNCRKFIIAMLKYTNGRNDDEFSIILNKKIKILL